MSSTVQVRESQAKAASKPGQGQGALHTPIADLLKRRIGLKMSPAAAELLRLRRTTNKTKEPGARVLHVNPYTSATQSQANESASERARRLLSLAQNNNLAESMTLGSLGYGRPKLAPVKFESAGPQKDELIKKVSLVSATMLNSFKAKASAFRKTTPAPITGFDSTTTKPSAQFNAYLSRHQTLDQPRPISARSRKLLEQLPPEHAGQIFANPLTGNRQVLSQLKATRQAMRHDMTAISSVVRGSSGLLQSHFRGLSSRQLSERIAIAFETYDTSRDGLLQVSELLQACLSFGMEVEEDEVGAFAEEYGSNSELNPQQFETMVRVAMGLQHADDVEETFHRTRSESVASTAQVDSVAEQDILTRASSSPNQPVSSDKAKSRKWM
mmetsp:Transcript_44976/g.66022  ORF Transcript_44976/g.66022 Transcript_44976/m.66022 type:complete len:385 (-) Transcript_44976:499-1653(-)